MSKSVKIAALSIVAAAAAATGIYCYANRASARPAQAFVTEAVARRDLVSTISATGTVEPEELVNVGAQVGGMITTFGTDADGHPVNYGSRVKSGMMLALIDPLLYKADVEQADASVQQAAAAIKSSEAEILQAKAKLELAQLTWQRYQKLNPSGAISRSDYDSARTGVDAAAAALSLAEANLTKANAQQKSAQALLDRARYNLKYCVISSPVDGVIIDRRVNIGQTVVSSMSAPSLFLIAKDLKKMQVWVSVNEADVGSIRPGMAVEFTADAFGGRKFSGVVQKIRLNATMSQNVVTYVVEVGTDNSDGTLLPYLTANVRFITAERKNTLSVPNAALRWTPASGGAPAAAPGRGIVWTPRADGAAKAIEVSCGLNSGSFTEVSGDGLTEGTLVITSVRDVAAANVAVGSQEAGTGSPFMPKPPKHASGKTGEKK